MSREFGPKGVRVNSISRGPVGTDILARRAPGRRDRGGGHGFDADTARERIVAGIGGFASGRFTTPEEVATLIVRLASERLGNVTGANYLVEGGLLKTT